jgi:hypothetical protein
MNLNRNRKTEHTKIEQKTESKNETFFFFVWFVKQGAFPSFKDSKLRGREFEPIIHNKKMSYSNFIFG